MKARSVFLVGYRATGKSTIGKILAARLDISFVDTDTLIEARLGMSIAECFERHGEPFFRDAESHSLETVGDRIRAGESLVVATGGGIVLRAENAQKMQSLGSVVWLTASSQSIRQRLEADAPSTAVSRPSLTGSSAVGEVDDVLRARTPSYKSVASITCVTDDGRTPEAIATELFELLRET